MTVIDVAKDTERLTMTMTAEYDVTAERAWQLWGDPRQLERWWGPPTYPATFVDHDLTPGARVTYFMTGPTGDQPRGFWDVVEVAPPRRLVVNDGFADDTWTPIDAMPTGLMVLDIADREGGGVVMTITSTFPSLELMEEILAMGMEEGMVQAMGQIDAVLAE
jgi:uncharacterized protein YndB with AHSA1/START domain